MDCFLDIPKTLQEPESMVVRNNSAITLKCGVIGSTKPSVAWYRNGLTFKSANVTITGHDFTVYSRLYLPNLSTSTMYNFQCKFKNKQGTIFTRQAQIHVFGKFWK